MRSAARLSAGRRRGHGEATRRRRSSREGTADDRPARRSRRGLEPGHRRSLRSVRRVRLRPLSPQQRAFLRLTRPLGLLDGTALLAAPSEFAKDAIERILRRPISDALGRHLGVYGQPGRRRGRVAASGGTEVPDPPGFGTGARPSGRPRRRHVGRRSSRRDGRRTSPTTSRRPAAPDAGTPTDRRARRRPRSRPGRRPRTPVTTRARHRVARLRRPAGRRPGRTAVADQAEREVHLRHVRHRRLEPVRHAAAVAVAEAPARGVQPAVRLGRLRAGQDPPAARHRALRPAAVPRHAGAVRLQRGVHQRLHQLAARRPQGRVPAPLPRRRRAAGRRHPVPGGQGRHPGGVLPHLQHAATTPTSRSSSPRTGRRSGWRPWRTGCAPGSSGA